jgi:hypothetical protein
MLILVILGNPIMQPWSAARNCLSHSAIKHVAFHHRAGFMTAYASAAYRRAFFDDAVFQQELGPEACLHHDDVWFSGHLWIRQVRWAVHVLLALRDSPRCEHAHLQVYGRICKSQNCWMTHRSPP